MNKLNAYIFVAAALTSVIPLLFIINISVKKLIADPKQTLDVQKQFFISVALSKITPVVLLIIGIVKLTYVENISVLYIPWLIIVIAVGFGLFFIAKQKQLPVSEDEKYAVNTLLLIARPLLFSIPIMAAAFIFLMTR